MAVNFSTLDVTPNQPGGAPVPDRPPFQPLNVRAYLLSPRRRTPVEDAPSLIGGKRVPALDKEQA